MSTRSQLPVGTTHLVRDTCFCLHAQRAARALARRFDEAFRPLGITSGQFSLLMSLNRANAPRIGEVAAVLAMDRTTLTANLKPLERNGLLLSTVDPEDRRTRRLALTSAGQKVLSEALPVWKRVQAQLTAQLANGDPGRLRADLRALS